MSEYVKSLTGLRIPAELGPNLLWRASLLESARGNKETQAALNALCKDDIVYWFGAFAWTFDPRLPSQHRPFVLWPVQVDLVLHLAFSILHGQDLLIEKSRDMGATWCCLAVLVHYWLFESDAPFLCASRKEDLVDKPGDPDSLFWKADYLIERLPSWMKPTKMARRHLHIANEENGSVIDGESTTGDLARGGRRKAILLDEFASVENGEEVLASTADATQCRILNSTPKGRSNAFWRARSSGKIKVITLPWWKHPQKAIGLYDLEGRKRSPWYDAEVARRTSPKEIGQEIDLDYLTSGSMFFDSSVLVSVRDRDIRAPFAVGELPFRYDPEANRLHIGKWQPDGGKRRLRLWIPLDEYSEPTKEHNYVAGVDVSNGTGASNSVISVVDVNAHEKVAEFASAEISPEDLARQAVAICRWFEGELGWAFLIWEANGPGGIFGKEVRRLGYTYVYFHRDERSAWPRKSDRPGFYSTTQSKELLLGEYRRALARGSILIRSAESIEEAWTYVYFENGGIGPSGTLEDEPSGARDSHGDRVIADALCVLGMQEQPLAGIEAYRRPDAGSPEWRRRRAEKARKSRRLWLN